MTTILTKREASIIAFLCVATTAFFSFVTWQMHIKDNIGGLVFGVFFLVFSIMAMIFGAIDFVKTLIAYKKHEIKVAEKNALHYSKYGNIKAGDCISKWEK